MEIKFSILIAPVSTRLGCSLSVLRKEADYFEMCFSKCDSFTQPQAKQENWILK